MLQLSQVDPIWQTDRVNPADAFDLFDEEVEFLNEDDVDLDEDEEEEEDGDDDDDEEEEEED
ncbi:hypothetical protein HMI56_002613 [Coelomomyces lativittatus]|nr:hypothetical protein HMI56_002613 [Coelomomyces lativittatus]